MFNVTKMKRSRGQKLVPKYLNKNISNHLKTQIYKFKFPQYLRPGP